MRRPYFEFQQYNFGVLSVNIAKREAFMGTDN